MTHATTTQPANNTTQKVDEGGFVTHRLIDGGECELCLAADSEQPGTAVIEVWAESPFGEARPHYVPLCHECATYGWNDVTTEFVKGLAT